MIAASLSRKDATMSIMTAEPSDTQYETVPRVEHGMVWLPDDNASIPRHDWADNVDVVL